MAEVAGLLVRLEATNELLRRQLTDAERATDKASRAMDKSMVKVDAAFDRVNKSISKATAALGG